MAAPAKRQRLEGSFTPLYPQNQNPTNAVMADRLNSDMGNLYKLLSLPTPVRGYPHPSENLISLCNLDPLANSVRRVDPVTGEKINKLRKSYEGKLKELHLAGRNKGVCLHDDEIWHPLYDIPDENWENLHVSGKEMSKGLDMELLREACRMNPGPLPKFDAIIYEQILDIDQHPINQLPKIQKPQIASVQNVQGGGSASNSVAPRPARMAAKRGYTDVSYEGYEDEDEMTDDARSGLSKRRRISEMLVV